MNKDRIAGAVKSQAGRAQVAAGKALSSPKHVAKGATKQAVGRAQNAAGKAKDAIKRAAKH